MIAHLNELEILGAEIDGETQVDIVLILLPESFNNFCHTYVGKWCAAEGSEVSGIREGCDHGFQNFLCHFHHD